MIGLLALSALGQAVTLSDDMRLIETPMLMTHDSATGFVGSWDVRAPVLRTQQVGLLDRTPQATNRARARSDRSAFDCVKLAELHCGARALDLRVAEDDGAARFHHLPDEGFPSAIGILDQTLDGDGGLPAIKSWAAANPSELVVVYISHCFKVENDWLGTISKKDCYSTERGTSAAFFADKVRALGIYIVNDEDPATLLLHTLTLGETKQRAIAAGSPGVYVIFDGPPANRVLDNYGGTCQPVDWACMDGYINNKLNDATPWAQMTMIQAFWQTVPVPTKDLNAKLLAGDEYPIYQAANNKQLNMLEINWICDSGKEISTKLGATVSAADAATCSSVCASAAKKEAHAARMRTAALRLEAVKEQEAAPSVGAANHTAHALDARLAALERRLNAATHSR